eukprot:SAG31_NODE_31266_length_370_cov_0.741697_1_plen_63_part_10
MLLLPALLACCMAAAAAAAGSPAADRCPAAADITCGARHLCGDTPVADSLRSVGFSILADNDD